MFRFQQQVVPTCHFCVKAMPSVGGWSKKDALAYLEAIKDEKACASCYYVYYKKFLDEMDRGNLLQTSKDCGCDMAEIHQKSLQTKGNSKDFEQN